jgi:hypothetical protein
MEPSCIIIISVTLKKQLNNLKNYIMIPFVKLLALVKTLILLPCVIKQVYQLLTCLLISTYMEYCIDFKTFIRDR